MKSYFSVTLEHHLILNLSMKDYLLIQRPGYIRENPTHNAYSLLYILSMDIISHAVTEYSRLTANAFPV